MNLIDIIEIDAARTFKDNYCLLTCYAKIQADESNASYNPCDYTLNCISYIINLTSSEQFKVDTKIIVTKHNYLEIHYLLDDFQNKVPKCGALVVSIFVSMDTISNKQYEGRWNKTPWKKCVAVLMSFTLW